MRFGVEKLILCPGDKTRTCGSFVMVIESDPKSLEAAMEKMLSEFAPKNEDGTPMKDFKINALRDQTTHHIVADVQTMQPHLIRKSVKVDLEATHGDKPASIQRRTQMTTSFILREEAKVAPPTTPPAAPPETPPEAPADSAKDAS
jgi:hypothetical protein